MPFASKVSEPPLNNRLTLYPFYNMEFIGGLILLFLVVVSSLKAIRYTDGAATPIWLLIIWWLPVFGASAAIIAIRKRPLTTAEVG